MYDYVLCMHVLTHTQPSITVQVCLHDLWACALAHPDLVKTYLVGKLDSVKNLSGWDTRLLTLSNSTMPFTDSCILSVSQTELAISFHL